MNRYERETLPVAQPLDFTCACSGETHRIRLEPSGRIRLVDHEPGSYRAALAAFALGGTPATCHSFLDWWAGGAMQGWAQPEAHSPARAAHRQECLRGATRRDMAYVSPSRFRDRAHALRMDRTRERVEAILRGPGYPRWDDYAELEVKAGSPGIWLRPVTFLTLPGHRTPPEPRQTRWKLLVQVDGNWLNDIARAGLSLYGDKLILGLVRRKRGHGLLRAVAERGSPIDTYPFWTSKVSVVPTKTIAALRGAARTSQVSEAR